MKKEDFQKLNESYNLTKKNKRKLQIDFINKKKYQQPTLEIENQIVELQKKEKEQREAVKQIIKKE